MSDRNWLAILFLSMAVLLVASFALSHAMGIIVHDAAEEVYARHKWAASLSTTIATIRDAESGQRGYLLTGRESYLRPYKEAAPKISGMLAALDIETVRQPEISAGLETLKTLVTQKMAELDHTITLRKEKGQEAAEKEVDTDAGMNLMHDILLQQDHLNALDDAQLTVARDRVKSATLRRNVVLIAVTIVDLAFLAWVFRRINHDRAANLEATLEIQRQKELLGVTLSSIGDAVLVTDTKERIVYLNPVAELLLQRTAAEAIGRQCGELFVIINEQSRLPVESPVTKVIEKGHIVGLANHTLLIRPDGSELPIDDAGSPVRDADGTLHGVVLIFRDFSAHRDASAKLIAANTDLQAAGRAKDQFMAMLSHELRTPLTPVLGTLTSWETNSQVPESLREDLKLMRWNVELEARLIDDLLDMTRITTGKLSMNHEVIDVHDTIRVVVAMYEREFASKQLQIDLDLTAPRYHASADTARMHQVFWNILKNAAKFTPKGGHVAVSTVCNEEGFLQVHVRDNGIGMTPQTLSRIFNPLEQGGPEITRRYGGLGLGMAISKSLVEAQNGTLTAQSPGIGGGSVFTVTLPAVDAPAPKPAAAPAKTNGSAKPLNILLVEDHPDTATVIRLILRKAGHNVEVGDCVQAGLQKIESNPYDLLLSDLGLPDGTGIDLIRQIRTKSTIPAIALTGYGMDDDVSRCREAGFDRHLTKPVNFQQLMAAIKELLPDQA